jgi:hypothetical protein
MDDRAHDTELGRCPRCGSSSMIRETTTRHTLTGAELVRARIYCTACRELKTAS